MMELKKYLEKKFHDIKIVNESKKLKNPGVCKIKCVMSKFDREITM